MGCLFHGGGHPTCDTAMEAEFLRFCPRDPCRDTRGQHAPFIRTGRLRVFGHCSRAVGEYLSGGDDEKLLQYPGPVLTLPPDTVLSWARGN